MSVNIISVFWSGNKNYHSSGEAVIIGAPQRQDMGNKHYLGGGLANPQYSGNHNGVTLFSGTDAGDNPPCTHSIGERPHCLQHQAIMP